MIEAVILIPTLVSSRARKYDWSVCEGNGDTQRQTVRGKGKIKQNQKSRVKSGK